MVGDSTGPQVRVAVQRLQRLQKLTGFIEGDAAERMMTREAEEAKLAGMTPYEQAQYRAARELQTMRENLARLEQMEADNASMRLSRAPHTRGELARVSQDIRRAVTRLVDISKEVSRTAATEKRAEEAQEVHRHIERARALWKLRSAGASAAGGYGSGSDTDGGESRGPSPMGRSEGVALLSDADLLNGAAVGSECRDALRNDSEFVQFFEQVAQRDQQIDQVVDRLVVATQRVKEQAMVISEELRVQSALLDDTDTRVEKVEHSMKTLNGRLRKTLKDVDQDRVCIYAVCFVLLLGVVGFILLQTGAVQT